MIFHCLFPQDQLVHASPADVPFEFELLSDLLTSIAKRDFEKERAEIGVCVCCMCCVCICVVCVVYVCVCVVRVHA